MKNILKGIANISLCVFSLCLIILMILMVGVKYGDGVLFIHTMSIISVVSLAMFVITAAIHDGWYM